MKWGNAHQTSGRLLSHGSLSPKPWSNISNVKMLLGIVKLCWCTDFSCRALSEDTWRGRLLESHGESSSFSASKEWTSQQFQWWWYLAHFDPMWNDMNNWETASLKMTPSLTKAWFSIFLNMCSKMSSIHRCSTASAAWWRCGGVLSKGKNWVPAIEPVY